MSFETMNHNERMKLFKERKKRNKINKMFVALILSVITMFIFIFASGIACYIDTHYAKDALVIYVDDDTNEVACVTIDGNEWSFFEKGFKVEDEVRLTFFTANTDNTIYDDEIVKVKKIK